MAEYPAHLAPPARFLFHKIPTARLPLWLAVAGAFVQGAPAASAQSVAGKTAPSSVSAPLRQALMSRPRWEVSGSSIAPPTVVVLPERSAWGSKPRASYAWLSSAEPAQARLQTVAMTPSSTRAGLGARTVAAPATTGEPTVTMSVTAPGAGSAQGPVTLRIEVPTPGSAVRGSTDSEIFGSRPGSMRGAESPSKPAGSANLGENVGDLSPREKAQQEARDIVARQKQFELALANKKRIEAEAMARALDESERVTKRNRIARADLAESVRDLDQFRSILQKAFLDAGPDATGLNPFVRTAQRYAGTPYVWGGESRNGFDCSGFIMVVMRDLGYKALPHSAAEQFNYGMPVARGLLKPGDLVFFQNTYKPGISHVGIYLGGGRFIHAAGTGKGTIVSHLASSPFAEKYAGARRLFRNRG